jgi:hypothetical protein
LSSRQAWAKQRGSISKISRAKRAGNVAQVLECLPSKYEALSLNPGTPLRKREREREREREERGREPMAKYINIFKYSQC